MKLVSYRSSFIARPTLKLHFFMRITLLLHIFWWPLKIYCQTKYMYFHRYIKMFALRNHLVVVILYCITTSTCILSSGPLNYPYISRRWIIILSHMPHWSPPYVLLTCTDDRANCLCQVWMLWHYLLKFCWRCTIKTCRVARSNETEGLRQSIFIN